MQMIVQNQKCCKLLLPLFLLRTTLSEDVKTTGRARGEVGAVDGTNKHLLIVHSAWMRYVEYVMQPALNALTMNS